VSETQVGAPLSSAEREELERLRAEVAQLRRPGTQPPTPGAKRPRAGWARTTVAVLLVTIGCLLAPLSVVAVWANSQITDQTRYLDTVAPISESPQVQAAVTDDITNRVLSYVDVAALTTEAVSRLSANGTLPPTLATSLNALAKPLADGVKSFVHDQVANVVGSQAFSDAWLQANRVAHQEVIGALTGEGAQSVSVSNGQVSVNLGPIVQQVKTQLVAQGFTLAERIPAVNATFVVFDSPDITRLQRGIRALDTLGTWLPVIVLLVLAGGVYVARSHRLALVGAGLGLAASMLLLGILLAVLRRAYLDAVPPDRLPADAATVLFDTIVRFLRQALRAAAVLGLVVGLGAFFTGASVTATRSRALLVRGASATRRGVESLGLPLGSVGRWVAPKTTLLRTSCLLVAAAVLIIASYPSPVLVLWVTVGVLVALFIVQVLASPAAPVVPRATAEPLAPRQRQPV
jgi:hypothetical protein